MVLFRMSKERHSDDLSGQGAEKAGARWNQKGVPALYLAENRSLAILETIVHCHNIKDLKNRLVLSIEVPDSMVEIFDKGNLLKDWNATPYINYTIDEGSKWLMSLSSLTLKMPSAIVPDENIFIINPRHPEFKKIKIVAKEVFKPDHRLILLPKSGE